MPNVIQEEFRARRRLPRVELCGAARHTLDMYSPAVLDHFENPRNAGTLADATATVSVSNPVCGDMLELAVRMEGNRVVEARFRTRGCVTAMACSSLLTELLRNRTLAELPCITPAQISESLGALPPATFHGAQLAGDAVAALLDALR